MALYSNFGIQTIESGTKVTPFGFQGSYSDSTGLVYLINRYYDPATDAFMSIDPDIDETDQPYVFTNDDPLNGTDPLGLKGWYCVNGVSHYYSGNQKGKATGKCKNKTTTTKGTPTGTTTTIPTSTKHPPATTTLPVTQVPSQVAKNQSNNNAKLWCESVSGVAGVSLVDSGAAIVNGVELGPETGGASIVAMGVGVVAAGAYELAVAFNLIPNYCPKG